MSIKVTVVNEDSEVLESFRVVCLESENNVTAEHVKNVIGHRYDIEDDNE